MAVYTHVSSEDLSLFLKDYEIGELKEFEGISEGVENTNYKLKTEKNSFILTIYEDRVEKKDIPFFLEYMFYLSSNGIKCPLPLRNNNNLFAEILGKPASVLTFLDGKSTLSVTEEQAYQLGLILGQIHNISINLEIKRENPLGLDSFPKLIKNSKSTAETFSKDLNINMLEEYNRIKSNWPEGLPKGIIHADLFPDNILFHEGQISGVIDFSFSCNDFLSYDLSICINAWCFKDGEFDISLSRNLLKGYQKERKLSNAEIEKLPILCSGSALRFLLTRLVDWRVNDKNAMVTPKNPYEFIKILDFHKDINNPEEYGI
tara:strand:- start:344 stop:1297 length:954 start_codon:yes stop_codon:yes gene_type:complete